jgi:hypothetical protein
MADVPWTGNTADKFYLQSGEFSSTVKTSQYVGGIDWTPSGMCWDGQDTVWSGFQAIKLYLHSGQFTSTLKTSQAVSSIDTQPRDVSWDKTNTPWTGDRWNKRYLQSGQFSSTLKSSLGTPDFNPTAISTDGPDTPWAGIQIPRLFLTSGRFTTTLKAWLYVGGIDTLPTGITWNGTYTPWMGTQADKLYLQSGHFTSTVKTSQYVGGIDFEVSSLSTNNFSARVGPIEESVVDTLVLSDDITSSKIVSASIIDTLVFTDGYVLRYRHSKKCKYIRHWARWILASVSKYFAQHIEKEGYTFLVEGEQRDIDLEDFIEFRLDGPDLTELNPNYYRLDVDINLLWSHNQGLDNYLEPARIRGLLTRAMRDICIYRYGDGVADDDSLLGILKLKQDRQNSVRVNNFGQVRVDVQLFQGTVEGAFEMHLDCH